MKSSWIPAALAIVLLSAEAHTSDKELDLPWPQRPLEWKEVNFLSTSDTHGWLLGHQHSTWPEPNYSGDFGDFASFAIHLRRIADEKGVDLLLVDAGDHHDGSGLVSSSAESAARTDEIFSMLEYDVLTIGNHELYEYESARELHDHGDRWKGRYLTSNVNITKFDEIGDKVSVPVGERFASFRTKTGRQVTAFGFIFNYQWHDRNLTVQAPALMATEEWFKEAIHDAPDYFVLVGHMPARGESAEWNVVFETIRQRHPLTPIYIFGGHTHVRDCAQFDDRSIAVVPGRYLETVAFTSSSLPADDSKAPLKVARRYLDANRRTYKFHSRRDLDFDTPLGRNVSAATRDLAAEYQIHTMLGTAPHDFFLYRHPYGHPQNLLTEFVYELLPRVIADEQRSDQKRVIICHGGSLRFDLFGGNFDRNDALTISPFPDAFFYCVLPAGMARDIIDQMNRDGTTKLMPGSPLSHFKDDQRVGRDNQAHRALVGDRYVSGGPSSGDQANGLSFDAPGQSVKRTLGYVTKDACPGVGDDIEHLPVPFSPRAQPDFISSPFPLNLEEDEPIDVVVMDFTIDDLLIAANIVAPHRKLTFADFKPYAKGKTDNLWGRYADMRWQD